MANSKFSVTKFKTKAQFACTLCLCFLVSFSGHVLAQSNDINNRLSRLENELQTINQAVFRGEDGSRIFSDEANRLTQFPVNSSNENNVLSEYKQSNFEVRLQTLEQEIRTLTGRVEEFSYENQQLNIRLNALEAQQKNTSELIQQPKLQEESQTNQPLISTTIDNEQQILVAQDGSFMEPAALYEMSFALLKEGQYETAQKSFESFLKQHPDHRLASNATYWLGETYYVQNKYSDAAKLFAQGYQKYPNGAKTPDSLLKLALSLNGMDKIQEACIAIQQLQTEFPGASSSILQRAENEKNRLGCS